jgi:hypothetical protein
VGCCISKSVKDYDGDLLKISIDNGIELFRCIKALDIFEHFYRQDLSVRVLNDLSRCEDTEKYVVEMLAKQCGSNYVKNIVGMFEDLLKQETYEIDENDQPEFEVTYKILSNNMWPFVGQRFVDVPIEIHEVQDNY